MKSTLYHNARCSKSREALEILNDSNIDLEVVEYLKTPISKSELNALVMKLGIQPFDLIRKKEQIFREKYSKVDVEKTDWVQAMIDYPKLMERPILVHGEIAVIGRPPSKIISLVTSSASNS